jgi:phospholipase/carboxylesterase
MARELVHRVRPPAGAPDGALVLLHGRGADEHDLVPLIEALDPSRRLLGLTPRGPLALPPGGAHWYVVREIGRPDPATFEPTFAQLCEWFDELPERTGVPLSRTVIGGFSQGSVMSYALGLFRGRPAPAGIIALSGFIPEVEGHELELQSRDGLPVAIGHGSLDEVISVQFGRSARDRLTAGGLDVTYRESAMGHTIDERFIEELRGWLAERIPEHTSP